MDAVEIPWGWAALVVAPLALVLVTSFLKFSVVLSFLRSALGSPQIPPASAVVAIAALLSAFVMAPVALEMHRAAQPALEAHAQQPLTPALASEVATQAGAPLLRWLERHSGAQERALFSSLGHQLHAPQDQALVQAHSPLVVVPSFVLTELKEAFLIGFVLFVPFLVLELVVASVLMSLNLQTLNPSQVSLPFKLLLFVMIDGWTLITQGLVLGYL